MLITLSFHYYKGYCNEHIYTSILPVYVSLHCKHFNKINSYGSQSMNIFSCLDVDFRPFLPWGGSTGESNALCISYLLWVTNDCKAWWFKTVIDNDYPHSFCSSEVGSGLAEWFWCEMVIKMLARTATYEGLLEAGALLPNGSLM